jgi:hypothetical protein
MDTKKYRIVVVTPLGTIFGKVQDWTEAEYMGEVRFYGGIHALQNATFVSTQGRVFIPGDLLKKSFVRIEEC